MEQETNSHEFSNIRICEIRLKLPSLNDYTRACRANRYEASTMKRDIENGISAFIGKLPRFTKPVHIHFHWVETNAKRDIDNIAFGKKFILDAMVKRGKLVDDSRKYVTGFTDTFEIGKEYKVIIEIIEQK